MVTDDENWTTAEEDAEQERREREYEQEQRELDRLEKAQLEQEENRYNRDTLREALDLLDKVYSAWCDGENDVVDELCDSTVIEFLRRHHVDYFREPNEH